MKPAVPYNSQPRTVFELSPEQFARLERRPIHVVCANCLAGLEDVGYVAMRWDNASKPWELGCCVCGTDDAYLRATILHEDSARHHYRNDPTYRTSTGQEER